MPLIYDPEYQGELDKIKASVLTRNRKFWWQSLIASAVILVIAVLLLDISSFSPTLKISLIIILSTLVLISVINSAVTAIHGALTIVVGTVEWTGRKQLGEYKKPND